MQEIYPGVNKYIFGPHKWSSYLIKGNKNILIDAMYPVEEKVDILIITHSHYDHIFFANQIIKKNKCKVYASKETAEDVKTLNDKVLLSKAKNADIRPFKVDKILKDGEVLDFGKFKFEVMLTPGHIEGALCLYEREKKMLFSGDTWFGGEIYGTTKYPGGDKTKLDKSINRLKKLDIKLLLPGHEYL
jgi:glyoxylase-like metal-dependent hydrolase (beta-lactamase superfamily II)